MKTVLIIGSGISGLTCAIHCAENGDKAILVSPYSSERSQSVMAAGGINAALNTLGENDSVESHIEDTLKGGCNIASVSAVKGMCRAAPAMIDILEKAGVVFTRDEKSNIALRAFGGQSHKRTAFAGASTGKQIVTALITKAREHQVSGLIERRFCLWFHSLLTANGNCYGAIFFDEKTRQLVSVYADCVVMATGGQNVLFGKTTGTVLCDGYATARLFTQGVRLKNLEFIQYHPTTLETTQKRMLISEAARGEGGRLYYMQDGKSVYFMEDKYGPNGNLMPRDIVSKCIYDAPSQVYLDISHLGSKIINDRLFEIKELCQQYAGIDVEKESIPVYPSVHFFMGGIDVDNNHRTNIKGLYAIGECASIYHGANRLGGNSLLAAIYSGVVAADSVRDEKDFPQYDFSQFIDEQVKDMKLKFERQSRFSAVYMRQELAKIMNSNLGITRNSKNIQEGIKGVDYLLSIYDRIYYDTDFKPYEVYTLRSMLILAKAILLCADARRESRGAHIREDYPKSSEEFKCATLISYDDGAYNIEFLKEAQE